MPLERAEHGGGCCGVEHIYDFSHSPNAEVVASALTGIVSDRTCDCGECSEVAAFMAEAVLTDYQAFTKHANFTPSTWHEVMLSVGFKRVTRFLNSNSGNYCNVYHYCGGQPRGRNRTPDPAGEF